MNDKNQAMWDFLQTYPDLKAYLKFNSIYEIQGEISLNSVYGESWEKRFIGGHGIKRYDFGIVMMKSHDAGTSITNIENIFDVQRFMDWIENQNQQKNFPDFGENIQILSIENLQNSPNLAGISADGDVAKYMFLCRVRYYQ